MKSIITKRSRANDGVQSGFMVFPPGMVHLGAAPDMREFDVAGTMQHDVSP
jgi:hypothetical protein